MPRRIHKRVQYFERINLYGSMDDSHKWSDWCLSRGYRLIRSGPKVASWPNLNMSKFHIIAEREVQL